MADIISSPPISVTVVYNRKEPIRDPLEFTPVWVKWFIDLASMVNSINTTTESLAAQTGVTKTIPLAKLTPTGVNGSITVTNGLITSATAPT